MNRYFGLFILSSLIFGMSAVAQPYGHDWYIEEIHGPAQLGIVDTIAVDLNQDGLMDVVSASIEDGHLRAYINQGNYEFVQQYIARDVPGIFRVVAQDMNQDGLVDFLYPSIESNEIVLLVQEPGGFQKQAIATDVILPTDAQVADFNDDGLMDVVSISFENNEFFLHLQQPNGTFNSQVLPFFGQQPRKIEVGYFNDDSWMDILVASSGDGAVRLYVNLDGTGFEQQLISQEVVGARYVAQCDYNQDGLMDFVVSATDIDTVFLFVNAGATKFLSKVISNHVNGVSGLHCADIDGDQHTELISIASSSSVIYSHELDGEFDQQTIANNRDGYVSVLFESFDFNEPSKILTQAFYESRNLLYSANEQNQELVVWEDFPDGAIAMSEGDINNDGTEDIVVAGFRDDKVHWYDGNTLQHAIIADNIDGVSEVFVVDLDQDGNQDILSAASFGNRFYWHKNLGNKTFKTILIFDGAQFANGISAGDVDGDGDLEVIGTSGSDDAVRIFERQNEFFNVQLIDSSSDAPNELLVLDFNQDMLDDIVVPYYFSNEAVLYQSLGKGLFEKIVLSQGIQRAYDIVKGDYLMASSPEFLISSVTNGNLYHFINTPEGLELSVFITNIPQLNWFQILHSYNKLLVKSLTGLGEVIQLLNYPQSALQTKSDLKKKSVFGIINDQSLLYKLILVDLIFNNGFEGSIN
jgi:WD40 repeat protein